MSPVQVSVNENQKQNLQKSKYLPRDLVLINQHRTQEYFRTDTNGREDGSRGS